MKKICYVLVASVLFLGGCASTATTQPAPTQAVPTVQPTVQPTQAPPTSSNVDTFLADANSSGTQFDNTLPDKVLLDYGRGVCSELASGKTKDEIIQEIASVAVQDNLGSDGAYYLGYVAGVAVGDLCPQYSDSFIGA